MLEKFVQYITTDANLQLFNSITSVPRDYTYELTSALGKKFEEKNGSMLCGELRGGPDKAPLRSCGGCIEDACVLVEEYLKEHYHGV